MQTKLTTTTHTTFNTLSAEMLEFVAKHSKSVDKDKRDIAEKIRQYYLAIDNLLAQDALQQNLNVLTSLKVELENRALRIELEKLYRILWDNNKDRFSEVMSKSILPKKNA